MTLSQLRRRANVMFDFRADDCIGARGELIARMYGSEVAATMVRASDKWHRDANGILVPVVHSRPPLSVLNDVPVLVPELAKTNVLFPSITLNDGTWTKTNVTVAAGTATSPRNVAEACFLDETTATGSHYVFRVSSAFGAGTIVCVSAWVKGGAGRVLGRIGGSSDSGVNRFYANFDLNTGTVSAPSVNGLGVSYKSGIEAWGDDWYRVWVSGITNPASTTIAVELSIRHETGGVSSYTGEVGKGLFYWNAQVESGRKTPSSAIVTTSATVVRAVDDISFPFPLTAEDITIFVDGWSYGGSDFPDATYTSTTFLDIGGSASGTWRLQLRHDAGSAHRRPQYCLLAASGAGTQAVATVSGSAVVEYGTPRMRLNIQMRKLDGAVRHAGSYFDDTFVAGGSFGTGDVIGPVTDWGAANIRLGGYSASNVPGWGLARVLVARGHRDIDEMMELAGLT